MFRFGTVDGVFELTAYISVRWLWLFRLLQAPSIVGFLEFKDFVVETRPATQLRPGSRGGVTVDHALS